MAENGKTGEAVLNVIRYVLRVILILLLFAIVLVAIWTASHYGYNYLTHGLPKSKVSVTVKYSDDCAKKHTEFPIALVITNGSSRTIQETTVYAKAQVKGRSTNYAGFYPIEIHAIIKPGVSQPLCSRPRLKNVYLGCDHAGENCKRTYEDEAPKLIWSATSFDVVFQ